MSAYVRLSSAVHPVRITVKESDSNSYVSVAQENIDIANEWVKLSGLYTAASDASLQMYVEGPAAGVDIYVDSFYMVLVNAPNLVQNGGFEDGTTDNWVSYASSATISVVTNAVQSGSYSALVSSRTETYSGIAQEIGGVLNSGETYSVSAYVKLPSAGYTVKITANENSGTAYRTCASTTIEVAGTAYRTCASTTIEVANRGTNQRILHCPRGYYFNCDLSRRSTTRSGYLCRQCCCQCP